MRLKEWLLQFPLVGDFWGAYRSAAMLKEYRIRREAFAQQAACAGLVYDPAVVGSKVRSKLAARGYSPSLRTLGEIHTFAFVPRFAWHGSLLDELQPLGPVTEFDYVGLGYSREEFFSGSAAAMERRREMNRAAVRAFLSAHGKRPVDWVFIYANGVEILAETIRAFVEQAGVPVVGMCLDDKQSWAGPVLGGQYAGQIDIASQLDLAWTSATIACEWYLALGAIPVYLPEGFDPRVYRPQHVPRDIPVSFVGAAYGFRPRVIRFLQRHNVPVQTFGAGWRSSGWVKDQAEIFNRSAINLGMGGIGFSESLTNVKARDFEIPGTGGGLYLTTFNPDLSRHFNIGQEIACYRTRDELVELIRYYLAHPEEASEMAQRARARALREHRWAHRFQTICTLLGVLQPLVSNAPVPAGIPIYAEP